MTHHHECCHQKSCCSHEHEQACCSEKSGCHPKHDCTHENYTEKLLELADEAWREILKEKIKQQIMTAQGAHIEQLAKLIAESNQSKWKHKMAAKKSCCDLKEKMHDFFCDSGDCKR